MSMNDDRIERLARLSGLAVNASVVVEIRDELIGELARAGFTPSDLARITGLSRPRIYQILERINR